MERYEGRLVLSCKAGGLTQFQMRIIIGLAVAIIIVIIVVSIVKATQK